MATPRVTIDQLPIQATPEDTNELIIQDAGVTKRLSIAALRSQPSQGLLDHLADIDDAHDATAVSAAASGPNVIGTNVQLQLGELAVLVDGKISQTVADGLYVNLDGDTMTGDLILVHDPVGALEAATKQYVDNSIAASSEGLTEPEADALYVNVGGDTMTGSLVLPGNPVSALDAVPRQYVDTAVGGKVNKTGDNMTGPLTAPYYLQSDSAQHVAANSLTRRDYVDSFLPLAGGTLTGALIIDAAAQNLLYLDGTGPAHSMVARHTSTDATLGYLQFHDSGYARLAADPGPLYLRCGTTDLLTVAAGNSTFSSQLSIGQDPDAGPGVSLETSGRCHSHNNTENAPNVICERTVSAAVANGQKFCNFIRAGSIIGSINIASSTTTSYVTTSDPRTKTAPPLTRDATDAVARAQQLGRLGWRGQHIDPLTGQPEPGDWDFLSSHDIEDVAPYAVSGERDAVDEEGNPVYQQVSFADLVPLLFTALANALDRIDALEGIGAA